MRVIKLRRRAGEKPQSIFNDWSTKRDARISVVKVVTRWIDVAQGSRTRSLDKWICLKLRVAVRDLSGERLARTETVRLKLHPEVAVKIIATALGNNVDYAACGAPKLSIKTARLHLHFLYKLEGEIVCVTKLAGAEVCNF